MADYAIIMADRKAAAGKLMRVTFCQVGGEHDDDYQGMFFPKEKPLIVFLPEQERRAAARKDDPCPF